MRLPGLGQIDRAFGGTSQRRLVDLEGREEFCLENEVIIFISSRSRIKTVSTIMPLIGAISRMN